MKSLIPFTFILLLATSIQAQSNIADISLIGTWVVQEIQSDSQGAHEFLANSSFTILSDQTFTATIIAKVAGKWKKENDRVLLESSDTPGPIILTDVSNNNFTWVQDELNMKIIYKRAD